MPIADAPVSDRSSRFRREAWRIRAQGKGNPAQTQEQLRDLIDRQRGAPILEKSIRQPATLLAPALDWSKSALLGQRGAAVRLFADLVASRLLGPILPFDQRVALLREAGRRDIGRFEANLIIATVQHQLYGKRSRVRRKAISEQIVKSPRRRIGLARGIATALAVQSAILVALWLLTH
jgi:hypothetical protein